MANLETAAPPPGLVARVAGLRNSRLVRQNLILFIGGLVAGAGGFVYHAIAGRILGPAVYSEVASLVAVYAVANAPTYLLMLVLARYAATLRSEKSAGGVRHLLERTSTFVAVPSLLAVVVAAALSIPGALFLKLSSPLPLIWLGLATAVIWQVAIPRGILQGIQHFSALSVNLSLEMVIRTAALAVLLAIGFSVGGAMVAILLGAVVSYVLGIAALRELFDTPSQRIHLRTMARFSVTAAVGTLGILILYNMDVILAKHYLDAHAAGIYGGLNKIGTILYFLTLSVSQVMFPRVIEAISNESHPGRLLTLSGGIMCALGAGALVVFLVVPGLVVRVLFGPAFVDATPYIFPIGAAGLALSLNNLLVQFFMAAHDRSFIPILVSGCLLEGILIKLFHGSAGAVVFDVLAAVLALLLVLVVRCLLIMPKLHPVRAEVPPAS